MSSELLAQAAASWDVDWPVESFSEELELRGIDPASCQHLGDVYLASAARHGNHSSLSVLADLCSDVADAAQRAARADDVSAADLAQDLLDSLLFRGDSQEPGRLAQYGGRGPLRAWLRTCAVNLCLMQRRKRGKQPHQEIEVSQTPDPRADPELAALEEKSRGRFQDALRAAFAALEPRARTLLRFHYVDGLEQQDIATVYGVHPASISRWIATARRQILEGTRDRLQMDEADLADVWSAVQSQLDVSLRGLLRSRAG